MATEVVGFAVLSAREKEYLEVIAGELLCTSRLLPVQLLSCLEELQVLVVQYDLNLVFGSFLISPPSLKAVDNSE